jgi:multisubunit Na+/H+ antiporter MnhB subunit
VRSRSSLVAALGAVALARSARRRPQDADAEAGGTDPAATLPGLTRLPVLDASSRILFASILVLSLYFLFAGHNQPGGGFVGGLTAGAAISLRYVAGGVSAVRATFRFRPWTILGSGLFVAAMTALVPILTGNNVLDHAAFDRDLPVLGAVKTTTALIFDIGVYLVVIGLVLMSYEAFGDDVEPDGAGESPDDTAPDPRTELLEEAGA